jgi:hypothetical protein
MSAQGFPVSIQNLITTYPFRTGAPAVLTLKSRYHLFLNQTIRWHYFAFTVIAYGHDRRNARYFNFFMRHSLWLDFLIVFISSGCDVNGYKYTLYNGTFEHYLQALLKKCINVDKYGTLLLKQKNFFQRKNTVELKLYS